MSSIEIINQDYVLSVENTEYVIEVKSFSISNYRNLDGKPSINNVLLQGNVSNVDLGLPLATDLHLKEDVANKVIQLGVSATNVEYPSAKCVYDNLELKANKDLSNLSTIGQAVIDAKADKDLSNLSNIGQAVIDAKANKDLSNLSTTGQAVIDAKANINAANFSSIGKKNICNFIMPSTSYVDLTLGASGSTYTAPSNGWFLFNKNTTGQSSARFTNLTTGFVADKIVFAETTRTTINIPVRKDDIVKLDWDFNATLILFRFIYAEGSKP